MANGTHATLNNNSAPRPCAVLWLFPGHSREGMLGVVIEQDLREQLMGDTDATSRCQERSMFQIPSAVIPQWPVQLWTGELK